MSFSEIQAAVLITQAVTQPRRRTEALVRASLDILEVLEALVQLAARECPCWSRGTACKSHSSDPHLSRQSWFSKRLNHMEEGPLTCAPGSAGVSGRHMVRVSSELDLP